MSDPQALSAAVAKLYDTYPFPPEPLLDEPPPGYNWCWNWQAAYKFCIGQKLQKADCAFTLPIQTWHLRCRSNPQILK